MPIFKARIINILKENAMILMSYSLVEGFDKTTERVNVKAHRVNEYFEHRATQKLAHAGGFVKPSSLRPSPRKTLVTDGVNEVDTPVLIVSFYEQLDFDNKMLDALIILPIFKRRHLYLPYFLLLRER